MITTVRLGHKSLSANLSEPIDLTIPLKNGPENPNCFWAPMPEFSPVRAGNFVGSTAEGGSVNFFNVKINPHGNGTHTECVGHIATERYVLSECLKQFHFPAVLVSVYPQHTDNGDRVILREQLESCIPEPGISALLIRTMPNDSYKKTTNWSDSNPPYLHHEAVSFLVEKGIRHLLIDLPSVDRESCWVTRRSGNTPKIPERTALLLK
jgi:kynurenine formamidase